MKHPPMSDGRVFDVCICICILSSALSGQWLCVCAAFYDCFNSLHVPSRSVTSHILGRRLEIKSK